MILDYLAIGIIIFSGLGIIYVASRKFPILSSINLDGIKQHQQEKIKRSLIEVRLKRKLKALNLRDSRPTDGGEGKIITRMHKLYNYVKELERRYKEKITVSESQEPQNIGKRKEILLMEAKELVNDDNLKEAEDKLIQAISLDSRYVGAYKLLADIYVELKDYRHAEEIYKYLLKINSEDDKERGTDNGSESKLTVTSLSSEAAGFQMSLGELYMLTDRNYQAMISFQEAVRLEPNNPKYLDALLNSALKEKNIVLARETLEKLNKANPENENLTKYKQTIKEIKKNLKK